MDADAQYQNGTETFVCSVVPELQMTQLRRRGVGHCSQIELSTVYGYRPRIPKAFPHRKQNTRLIPLQVVMFRYLKVVPAGNGRN